MKSKQFIQEQLHESVGFLRMVNINQIIHDNNRSYLTILCRMMNNKMKIDKLWFRQQQMDDKIKLIELYQIEIQLRRNQWIFSCQQLERTEMRVNKMKKEFKEKMLKNMNNQKVLEQFNQMVLKKKEIIQNKIKSIKIKNKKQRQKQKNNKSFISNHYSPRGSANNKSFTNYPNYMFSVQSFHPQTNNYVINPGLNSQYYPPQTYGYHYYNQNNYNKKDQNSYEMEDNGMYDRNTTPANKNKLSNKYYEVGIETGQENPEVKKIKNKEQSSAQQQLKNKNKNNNKKMQSQIKQQNRQVLPNQNLEKVKSQAKHQKNIPQQKPIIPLEKIPIQQKNIESKQIQFIPKYPLNNMLILPDKFLSLSEQQKSISECSSEQSFSINTDIQFKVPTSDDREKQKKRKQRLIKGIKIMIENIQTIDLNLTDLKKFKDQWIDDFLIEMGQVGVAQVKTVEEWDSIGKLVEKENWYLSQILQKRNKVEQFKNKSTQL